MSGERELPTRSGGRATAARRGLQVSLLLLVLANLVPVAGRARGCRHPG